MFNQTCEYAIRAAIEIARRPKTEFVLAKELAEDLGLPHHYLSKILQQLVRSRVLESTRGRLGGFKLLRDPDQVKLVEIVAPFDDLKKKDECILGQAVCSDARACPLHEFWSDARARYLGELDQKTLGDFARFEDAREKKEALDKKPRRGARTKA